MIQSNGQPATVGQHRKIVWGAVAVGTVIAGWMILRSFAPSDSSYYPKCMLYQWTGLHCPGCGSTRALYALAHGQLWESIRFNPLFILGGPIIVAVLLYQRRRERAGAKPAPALIWCLVAILVLYSIARNVPSPTRSVLAPPSSAPNLDLPATRASDAMPDELP